MANNNFSTGKVHVDVNIGLNVNDVKIDQNEFNKAGKDAANAFNNGYQQVPPPNVTPNVNPPAGGGGGSGGGGGGNSRRASILGRQADSWELRGQKAADNGASQSLLNVIGKVKSAFEDWDAASDADKPVMLNDFYEAVRVASRELNQFNYGLKMTSKAFNESLRIDNQAINARKTARAWAERGEEVGKHGTTYANAQSQINGVQTALAKVENARNVNELNTALTNFKLAVEKADNAYSEFKQQLADTASIEKSKAEFDSLQTKFEIISSKNGGIDKWSEVMKHQAAGVAAAAAEFERIKSNKSTNPEEYNGALSNYRKSIDLVNASLMQMDSMHGTVAGSLSSMTKSMLQTSIAMKAFSYGRRALSDMVKEVTAIDSAMVNLRKVTDASDSAYQSFLDNAGDKARELGSTITDLIDATSTFAKMGYTLGEAEGLGQIATMFAGAADFSGADEAASVLISAVNGFADLEISDAESVADKLNEVSNRFAVTATDLSEGLTRSASALSAGGNSIDQTIAMLTTIAEVTRNASEAGSALKVLALRLRGAKVELENAGEDTEGMAESTAKLREQVAALTNVSGKGGVDIMADSKNFKETYQIMSEISKVWGDMSDIDQAALLELIAGKVRSNQVAALLSNMTKADSVLATSLGAENSVLKEHTRWLDSIEAKQKQLTATWQDFSQTVINSGLVKGTYDAGTGFLKFMTDVVDKAGAGNIALGALLTKLMSIGGAGSAWNFLRSTISFTGQNKADQGVIDAYNNAVLGSTADAGGRLMAGNVAAAEYAKSLNRELKAVEKTLIANANGNVIYTNSLTGIGVAAQKAGTMLKNLAASTAITAAITLAAMAISKIVGNIKSEINAVEESMEKLEKAESEYAAAQDELQGVNDELASTRDRMKEIKDGGTLTLVEQGELAKLSATEAKLIAMTTAYEKMAEAKEAAVNSGKEEVYDNRFNTDNRTFWQDLFGKDNVAFALGYDTGTGASQYAAPDDIAVLLDSQTSSAEYDQYLKDLSKLDQLNGPNIGHAINALQNYQGYNLTEEQKMSDTWKEIVGYASTVESKLWETFWDLDEAMAYYESRGMTNNKTYQMARGYVDQMIPVLGPGAEEYYNAAAYDRVLGSSKYGNSISGIVSRYSKGKIDVVELEKQLSAVDGLIDYINSVWIGENAFEKFCENIVASVETGIDTLASFETSYYNKWKELHDGKESGTVYDDALTALEDLREGLKSGRVGTKEYGAAQEFLLGDGKYSKDSEKLLNRYLTEDATGVVNFQQDLMKAGLMNKDGTMGTGMGISDVASALGISEELANAIFMKANEYIADESKKYVVNDSKELETPIDPIDQNTNATNENTKALISLKDIIKLDKKSGGNTSDGEGYDSPVDDPMLGNQRELSTQRYEAISEEKRIKDELDAVTKETLDGLKKIWGGFKSLFTGSETIDDVAISAETANVTGTNGAESGGKRFDAHGWLLNSLTNGEIDEDAQKYINGFYGAFKNVLTKENIGAMWSDFLNVDDDDLATKIQVILDNWNNDVYGPSDIYIHPQFNLTAEEKKAWKDLVKDEVKTIYINYVDGEVSTSGYTGGGEVETGSKEASGTRDAASGIHLVDEQGAELIEHTSSGTYELGTDDGPRMAKLKDGDIVHTAEETKEILARKARRRGRGFAAGNGLFKGYFGGGGSGASLTGSLSRDHNYAKDIGSAVYIPVTGIDGGVALEPPDQNNGGDNSAANKIKKALKWAEGLVDWIPRALEVLKDKTEAYVREAEKSIGFLAQNTKVDKAISNVRSEIELNMAAHARYMKQANDFAQRAGLSDDIIKLIHEGTIDIREYDENTRSVISEYEKWYEKANGCLDTIISLEDQMESLAQQKLDNIVGYFDNLNGLLDQQISSYQGLIDVKKAYGRELVEDDYYQMIADSEETVRNMVEEQKALNEELNYLVGAGLIQTGSDAWYEYATRIEELNSSISDAKVSISELSDEMNNLTLVNLQTGMKYLEDVQKSIESVGNLQDSQGKSRGVVQYRQLISIGMKQIDNLEMQNKEILKQMDGLDVLSEKYQELNDALKENQLSIMDIKGSQEEWNDSIIDLKLDALQKQNDIYQQRLNIMDALNGIEDARQRRVSVYKEGVGFTYEADQDAMREARNNLDSAMYDLLTQQLEASKEADNIYDSIGNQLVEVKDALTSVDFSKYYDSISSDMTNSKILSDALASANLGDIIAGAAGGGIQIDLSGMTLNNVNSVEDLGNAIVDQLPTYILQFMHEK